MALVMTLIPTQVIYRHQCTRALFSIVNVIVETAELVEDLAIDFITEMTLKSMDVGKKGKVHVEDIIYTIRKDPKKYARVKDLLTMNEELKKARKAFDDEVDNI